MFFTRPTSLQSNKIAEFPLFLPCLVNYEERSVRHGSPIVWNLVPQDVIKSEAVEVFIKKIKLNLF